MIRLDAWLPGACAWGKEIGRPVGQNGCWGSLGKRVHVLIPPKEAPCLPGNDFVYPGSEGGGGGSHEVKLTVEMRRRGTLTTGRRDCLPREQDSRGKED